jgi:hypothetical protein
MATFISDDLDVVNSQLIDAGESVTVTPEHLSIHNDGSSLTECTLHLSQLTSSTEDITELTIKLTRLHPSSVIDFTLQST